MIAVAIRATVAAFIVEARTVLDRWDYLINAGTCGLPVVGAKVRALDADAYPKRPGWSGVARNGCARLARAASRCLVDLTVTVVILWSGAVLGNRERLSNEGGIRPILLTSADAGSAPTDPFGAFGSAVGARLG